MGDALLDAVRAAVDGDGPRSKRADAAVAAIRAVTGARWVGVYTVADGVVSNQTWSGPAAPAYPTFPADQGLTAHAIAARAVAVSNDVARDPRYLTNQTDSGSELIVPIILDNDVVGTLDVEERRTGSFDGAAITRYEAVARQLATLWTTFPRNTSL
jgi:L-methionine (R)-S-oxide reductase